MKNNKTSLKKNFIFIFIISTVFSSICLAHDHQESFSFNDITCWDVMTLSEKDKPYALTMLYGYYAGIKGQSKHFGSSIEKTLKETGDLCAKKPDMLALSAIKKILN